MRQKESRSNERRESVEVWRPHDLTQLELRRGFAIARPVPRHWHEEYQLCFIQTGAGELRYRGCNFPTPPTSLFIVHPGEVHSNRSFDSFGCSFRSLYLDAELMRRAASEAHGKESVLPFFPTVVAFEPNLLKQYLDLYRALEQPTTRIERQTLLLNLLAVLVVRFAEQRPAPRTYGAERQALRHAHDYLAEHYAENVSLETLAHIAGLSPFHFNRVFSHQFGLPPHAFQTQMRVARAKTLLRQGLAIPQVAAQTGFFDQSHLNRHFKRVVGVSPGQYQSSSKNVQDHSVIPC